MKHKVICKACGKFLGMEHYEESVHIKDDLQLINQVLKSAGWKYVPEFRKTINHVITSVTIDAYYVKGKRSISENRASLLLLDRQVCWIIFECTAPLHPVHRRYPHPDRHRNRFLHVNWTPLAYF